MPLKNPPQHQRIMPYLILRQAHLFLQFVEKVFDATPTKRENTEQNTIRHAEVAIGDSAIMFADSTKDFEPQTAGLFVYVENADETYYKALDAGGQSIMPPADQSYGRSCGVTDPTGNSWWITSIL